LAARRGPQADLHADYTILPGRALRYEHKAMGHAHFDALADGSREAAHAALRQVLGAVPVDRVTPLGGGATSAAVFRIGAGGRHYVLRIEGAPSPLRNPHQYVSMRIASEAGIAPRLHYADEKTRVAVVDYVEPQPHRSFPGGAPALARTLGEILRRLQSTQVFPHLVEYPAIVARLWAHVCRTGLFAPGVLDPYNDRLGQIRESYVWDSAGSVSSHNDPVPANILFDGKRLWLIDWESAYRNDPLVDLAIVSDHFARTAELQADLMKALLGRVPDEALLTRLKPVRALSRLYYAGVFFSASALMPRAGPDTDVTAPTLAQFESAIRTGRLKPGTPATKHVLGKMYLASFLRDVPTPGFEAAV
jgi:aminoglycoside phosphotransferase (APT) family kinase protein